MTQLSGSSTSVSSVRIAFLVSNGFAEEALTALQRACISAGHRPQIIAPENGVVMGWAGAGWGLSFAVEAPIGSALGSDYDLLVLVGGARGVARLDVNPHTRRIVGHFLDAEKPMLVMDEAHRLLVVSGRRLDGQSLAEGGDTSLNDSLREAGASLMPDTLCAHSRIISAQNAALEEVREALLEALALHGAVTDERAAA